MKPIYKRLLGVFFVLAFAMLISPIEAHAGADFARTFDIGYDSEHCGHPSHTCGYEWAKDAEGNRILPDGVHGYADTSYKVCVEDGSARIFYNPGDHVPQCDKHCGQHPYGSCSKYHSGYECWPKHGDYTEYKSTTGKLLAHLDDGANKGTYKVLCTIGSRCSNGLNYNIGWDNSLKSGNEVEYIKWAPKISHTEPDPAEETCDARSYWVKGSREYLITYNWKYKRKGYHNKDVDSESTQAEEIDVTKYDVSWCVDTNALGMTEFGTEEQNSPYSNFYLTLVPNTYRLKFKPGLTNHRWDSNDNIRHEYQDREYDDYIKKGVDGIPIPSNKFSEDNKFIGRDYEITFKANGGKWPNNDTTKTKTGSLKFAGWVSDNTGTEYEAGTIFGNVTAANRGVIPFEANWYSFEWAPENLPERENYEFNGWEIKSGASDTVRLNEDGQAVISPATTKADVVVVAKWKPVFREMYFLSVPTTYTTRDLITGKGDWWDDVTIKGGVKKTGKYSWYNEHFSKVPEDMNGPIERVYTAPEKFKENEKHYPWDPADGCRSFENREDGTIEDKDPTYWDKAWRVPGYHYIRPESEEHEPRIGLYKQSPKIEPVAKYWIIDSEEQYHIGYRTDTDDPEENKMNADSIWVKKDGNESPRFLWIFCHMTPNKYKIKYDKNQPSNDFDFEVQGTVEDTSGTFDAYLNLADGGYTCVGYDLVGWSTVPGTYEEQLEKGKVILSEDTDLLDEKDKEIVTEYDHNAPVNGDRPYTPEKFPSYTGEWPTERTVPYLPEKASINLGLGLRCRNLGGWTTSTDAEVTLYAIWKPIPYKVVYTKGNSGEISQTVGMDTYQFDEENLVWSKEYPLLNNTPQLSGTPGTDCIHFVGNDIKCESDITVGKPHFTSSGYYVDYWTVKSITGHREKSRDTTGKKLDTLTGYTSSDTSSSATNKFLNLCAPTDHDCVVTLEAHWAPIRYKVTYNNDTSIPSDDASVMVDRKYEFSTETAKTEYRLFGEKYKMDTFNPTRSNKYGKSTFLGYCFTNGDTSKSPTYAVRGKTPQKYMALTLSGKGPLKEEYTATDWKGSTIRYDNGNHIAEIFTDVNAGSLQWVSGKPHLEATHATEQSTNQGVTYDNYFAYINEGEVGDFNLYAVWDDCPGIEPIDTEQRRDWSMRDFNTDHPTPNMGTLTRSGTDMEYKILMLEENRKSVWDREDDVSDFINPGINPNALKERYYLDNFSMLKPNEGDWVHTYEVRYTLVDANGNKYQTSRKIYSGYLYNIMLYNGAVDKFQH